MHAKLVFECCIRPVNMPLGCLAYFIEEYHRALRNHVHTVRGCIGQARCQRGDVEQGEQRG